MRPSRRFLRIPFLRIPLSVSVALCAASAGAAQVDRVEVEREGGRFRVEMHTRLAVPPQAAYEVFSRFEDLPRINPSVRRAVVVGREGADTRVESRLRVCIAFFCPKFKMTQDMRGGAEGDTFTLRAAVVPERSDFRYGLGLWTFAPCGDGTRLSFVSELEPGFWIPRLIGTWLVKGALRAQAVTTSEGIERLARQRTGEPAPEAGARSEPTAAVQCD